MEFKFEPRSELGPADELRQAKAQIAAAGGWKSVLGSRGWEVGWPRAKIAVMEAEKEVQQFAVPWADAWARAEVRAWAEIKAMLGRAVLKQGVAGALLLAEALGEARAQVRGAHVPDRLADPRTIAEILTFLNGWGLARRLWDDSLKMEEEYRCIIQFITPITRC